MMYQYQERSRRRRGSSIFKSLFKVFLFYIIVAALFTASFFLLKSIKIQPPTQVLGKIVSPIAEPTTKTSHNTEKLARVVNASLKGTRGRYAVAIKNLKTGEEFYQDEHLVYEAASLYKLWIMLTVFQQMKDGKFNEDVVLKSDVKELNKKFAIASEAAELTDGEVEMTVASALTKMITLSDNYAALLLSAKIRLSSVNAQLLKYNLSESTLSPPKTTAFDMLKYYELLYNNDLIDRGHSERMVDLLAKQQLNDRIPKYLPAHVKIAHKTGEIDDFKHDAGIVYANNGDYIIVLLSRSEDARAAAEREAQLSRDVYNYFQNN